jgi:hypothetical protein
VDKETDEWGLDVQGIKLQDLEVPDRLGVYTPVDYWAHVGELVQKWNIGALRVSGSAARAQDELGTIADQKLPIAEALTKRLAKSKPESFSWIYGKEA